MAEGEFAYSVFSGLRLFLQYWITLNKTENNTRQHFFFLKDFAFWVVPNYPYILKSISTTLLFLQNSLLICKIRLISNQHFDAMKMKLKKCYFDLLKYQIIPRHLFSSFKHQICHSHLKNNRTIISDNLFYTLNLILRENSQMWE